MNRIHADEAVHLLLHTITRCPFILLEKKEDGNVTLEGSPGHLRGGGAGMGAMGQDRAYLNYLSVFR